ncbi:DUF4293 domain-containing protein [Bacteroides ihuae]|uniref:DUF4293 domain-containing protein n=1 Tax=Bacteroides ihuae TaxID=1852362 RepID=UPI0008DAD66C|nr:DUF4293 domain-containing protein [Bacteroides ihuae]
MIQRIQTIFLLLVTGLLVASMCLPIGYFMGADAAQYTFMPAGIVVKEQFHSTWGVLAILLLSTIISFSTIFMYKNRMLQIRMSVFCSVLLLGYYLAFLAFMFILKSDLEASFRISWALCLPVIAIILNYLAIRAIGRDEVMVKAAERLR